MRSLTSISKGFASAMNRAPWCRLRLATTVTADGVSVAAGYLRGQTRHIAATWPLRARTTGSPNVEDRLRTARWRRAHLRLMLRLTPHQLAHSVARHARHHARRKSLPRRLDHVRYLQRGITHGLVLARRAHDELRCRQRQGAVPRPLAYRTWPAQIELRGAAPKRQRELASTRIVALGQRIQIVVLV